MEKNSILLARLSGISLLLMALLAGLAFAYFYPKFSTLDPEHLNASLKHDFQLMLFTWVLILLLDIAVSLGIWRFFNNTAAGLSALLRLIYSGILALAVFHLAQGLHAFGSEKSLDLLKDAMAQFQHYWSIGLIVFGFHIASLSVVFKSFLGLKILLQIGGWSYIIVHGGFYLWHEAALFQQLEQYLSLPMALSELLFAFALLFKAKALKD